MENISAEKLREMIETDYGERVLDLRGKGLSKVPEAVTDLTELEKLYLSYNYLKELPTRINKLKNLEWLILDKNQLRELPHSICELSNLTVLIVNNNQLSVLPSNIKHLKNLRSLYLRYNQLTTLPDEIGELKKLGRLYVAGNPLTLEGMRKVVKLQNKMKFYTDVTDLDLFKQAKKVEEEEERQRAQLAYEKALRDGSVNVYRGRILLIGQDRAGKTSLKKSLLGLPFDPKEQSTEGIEVHASTCEIEVKRVKNWHSTNENKPGLQEYSRDISRIVAEKLSDGTTELEKGHSTAATEATATREDHCKEEEGGLSNRNDLNKHQVEENEPEVIISTTSPPDDVTQHVHQFLKYVGGGHAEGDITKEESVASLDVWDFAGQHLYYASHPLFLSSRALYILVHNLSKPLHAPAEPCMRQGTHNIRLENPNNETNLENLLSWLTTIHSIAQVREEPDIGAESRLPYLRPPVLIVGTHADKAFEGITVMKSQIEKTISGREYGRHVVPPLFSIDNTSSLPQNLRKRFFRRLQGPKERKYQIEQKKNTSDIQDLRDKIMEVLEQEPYMGEKIPVRWFLFEKVIEALIEQQIYHRQIEQLQNYAEKNCFIEDADEFAGMISFYHGLGMIIKHRSTVVLKAQWLIDLLKQLINIPHFDKMDPVQTKYWQELEKNGILCMEHIDHVFSKFIQQGVIKDDILDMMEQFGLIAKFSPSPSDVKYFVPAQLKTSPKDLCQMTPSDADPCPLYIHFVYDFVPHGLFSQLVSRFIRWCCKTWPLQHPKLYQNGAWFVIGKQILDLIVICKKSFIKIVLRQRMQSHQVSAEKSEELATQVREFVEETLQTLSQELPYLSGLKYQLCVACPYCHQGGDGAGQECSNHGRVSCVDEECFHLLEVKEDQQLICMEKFWDEVRTVHGLEKWFLKRTSQDLSPSTRVPITQDAPAKGNKGKSDKTLNVTLVASEWDSSKGGLSTLNRELAIELAKHEQVKVTLLVPQDSCSEEGKRNAESHKVSIREAERRPGYDDPLDWLSFPPRDLAIDIIVGHGRKLGKQAQVIRESHGCKWVKVLDTDPEELGMYKDYSEAISKGEERNTTEVDLCRLADGVVAVGPKVTEEYSSKLRSCGKDKDIIQLTPGIFDEFSDVIQVAKDDNKFKVLTFGCGDPEDFSLRGYDIAAKAIAKLEDRSYRLIFVGASDGKQEEVAKNLLKSGISGRQLRVRKYLQSKERLKGLFCEVDLVIMPSRTEGFGLTALEALSAGLPILVNGKSGFGDTLCTLPLGKPFVVDSADPKDWAKAIAAVRLKDRTERLQEIQRLRTSYEEKFSWGKQCEALVKKMWSLVHVRDFPFHQWTQGECVGAGNFGKVYKCHVGYDFDNIVAVKIVKMVPQYTETQEEVKALNNEIRILKTLRHERIVSYYGSQQKDGHLHLFMDFMAGGSLSAHIKNRGVLLESESQRYTKQLLKGVKFLHSQNVIHRDIKGSNVLLDGKGNVKLADFGLSKLIQKVGSKTNLVSHCGTPYWMAPEIFWGGGYGRKADIWSLGCTVVEMLTGKPPLRDLEPAAAMFRIGSRPIEPTLPDNVSQYAKEFITAALTWKPDERPWSDELLCYAFVDWMADG